MTKKTFKEFVAKNWKDNLQDIAEHGADCGYEGLVWHEDLIKIYDHFASEIYDLLQETEFLPSLVETAAKDDLDYVEFRTLAVYAAIGLVACSIVDEKEAA